MNIEEKIRKYLEGELSQEELKSFVEEINNSPSLKRKVEAYRDTINNFKVFKNIKTGNEYFVNLLPRFREKRIKQNRILFKPSLALTGIASILIISAILFIVIYNQEIIEDEQITFQNLNPEEINEYLDSYSQEIPTSQMAEDFPEGYDSLFSAMIQNELNTNKYPEDYFVDVSSSEFYSIIDELSDEELEGIYNSLIKEDFN